ncbi:MAG: hypothetical protein ACRDAM_00280 [Casimicrobium sp.]
MTLLPSPQEIAFKLSFLFQQPAVGSRLFALVVLADIAFWTVVAYAWKRHGTKMQTIKCGARFVPVWGSLWV